MKKNRYPMVRRAGWLIFLTFGVFMLVFQTYQHMPMNAGRDPLVIDLPMGGTVHTVVEQLESSDQVRFPKVFRYYVALMGRFKPILAGEYNLNPGMTPHGFLNKLQSGDVNVYRTTIVEGWTFKQLQERIDEEPSLVHEMKGIEPAILAHKLGLKHATPEGTLMPTTYHFPAKASDWEFYQRAFRTMQDYLQHVWPQRDPQCPFRSPYEALIVASMIEREASYLPERPLIAGVIVKRLKKHMSLQVDASVRYGLHAPKRPLTLKDLHTKTPYNTYLFVGLPPTPIAMPSASAIDAALHPHMTDAIYYVATPDGHHHFSKTYQEHLKAAQSWRQSKTLVSLLHSLEKPHYG